MKLRTKIVTSFAAVLAIGASGMAMAKDHGRGMQHEAAIAAIRGMSGASCIREIMEAKR